MPSGSLPLLRPDWSTPAAVGAGMSLRAGGVSQAPWGSLNLGLEVGDEPVAVAENRRRFADALQARPVWLRQVHGTAVIELTAKTPDAPQEPADAAWTRERGLACAVMVADCMPVLFALRDGSAVAAAHAGWRGLAGGVLDTTVQALCTGTGARPSEVMAWLGPCIGPRQFEVGADVLEAFGVRANVPGPDSTCSPLFRWRPRPDGAPRWLADLRALAQARLLRLGLPEDQISSDAACTVEQASEFFSFRRDGRTGRHACAIWRR
jgi:YfiH family protein